MIFNSLEFLVFLPTVFGLYWLLQKRSLGYQNLLIVVVSYVFYGWWDWRFLSLIVISSVVDYHTGLWLGNALRPLRRRWLLAVSMVSNLGILGFFKYFDFFIDSLVDSAGALGVSLNVRTLGIILPVGISFYTFQTMSYTIDIYRRRMEPTRDVVAFFAFVSFFPQLVAGPIERASNLLPQFQRKRTFDPQMAQDGLRQILWGLFKKMVIADNLAGVVDIAFSSTDSLDGSRLANGVFFFAIQIYCDFSGYSDIAIGTSRLFGFSLMRNFAFPYFSRDIGEFWRRWHISLSTWFRDYVFIPLGGNRTTRARYIRNLIVTFTVSGLWHGANWTFVVWGVLNAIYYLPLALTNWHAKDSGTRQTGRLFPTVSEGFSILLTFVLTLHAWVFFRAASVGDAVNYIAGVYTHSWSLSGLMYYKTQMAFALGLLGFEWVQRSKQYALQIAEWPVSLRWLTYYFVIALMFYHARIDYVPFIYFQF